MMARETASMPRYYFHLTNGRPFHDVDGLELSGIEAAREEAVGFALDIMRLEPECRDWSSWSVAVTDRDQTTVLQIPFSEAG
jgi:hypothetical protein